MNTKQILVEFSKLFEKWGLSRDDYCFGAEYALKYQGVPIKPRKKHFDFFVNSKKLPWKVIKGAESTTPPRGTKEFIFLQKFIKQTGSDPHFLPLPLGIFKPRNLLPWSYPITVASGKKLRIIKPYYQLFNYYDVFNRFDVKTRWPEEKITRWLNNFNIFLRYARQIRQQQMLRLAKNAIALIERKKANSLQSTQSRTPKLGILKGLIGSRGYARGKARIVTASKDLKKVKKGDIIVAHYVKTELVSVLSKIKAIVTDQGGMGSHAVIISRENKLPCIIGTEIATKVFKDGDLVEVDANKGVVKKL